MWAFPPSIPKKLRSPRKGNPAAYSEIIAVTPSWQAARKSIFQTLTKTETETMHPDAKLQCTIQARSSSLLSTDSSHSTAVLTDSMRTDVSLSGKPSDHCITEATTFRQFCWNWTWTGTSRHSGCSSVNVSRSTAHRSRGHHVGDEPDEPSLLCPSSVVALQSCRWSVSGFS